MSYPSILFGRIGSVNNDTGLFALEGGQSDFKMSDTTISSVALSRDGYEMNSGLPFHDGRDNPYVKFFNKLECYAKSEDQFWAYLDYLENDFHNAADMEESVIWNIAMHRIMAKRYVNETFGLIPKSRVIKAILKAQGVVTKRIMVFGSCIAPEDGGALWLVSPTGFPWKPTPKHIIEEGTPDDLRKCQETNNFLYMGMTGAVPFISGHRQRQPDEEYPRILRIPTTSEGYEKEFLDMPVNVDDTAVILDSMVTFVENLYVAGRKSGIVKPDPSDIFGDDMISLDDSDFML